MMQKNLLLTFGRLSFMVRVLNVLNVQRQLRHTLDLLPI